MCIHSVWHRCVVSARTHSWPHNSWSVLILMSIPCCLFEWGCGLMAPIRVELELWAEAPIPKMKTEGLNPTLIWKELKFRADFCTDFETLNVAESDCVDRTVISLEIVPPRQLVTRCCSIKETFWLWSFRMSVAKVLNRKSNIPPLMS